MKNIDKDELLRKEIANRLRVFADIVEVDVNFATFSGSSRFNKPSSIERSSSNRPKGMRDCLNISAIITNPTTRDVLEIDFKNVYLIQTTDDEKEDSGE